MFESKRRIDQAYSASQGSQRLIEPNERNVTERELSEQSLLLAPSYSAGSQSSLEPIVRNVASYEFRYLLVLDETGRVDLLDREKLEFAGTACYLPAPRRSLLAYEVLPLALDADQKYRGMYVASVNREGTALSLYVFNEEGQIAASETSRFTHYLPRGREHYIPTSTAKKTICCHHSLLSGSAVNASNAAESFNDSSLR